MEVTVQDGGTYNITVGNGYTLVQGNSANRLAAVASDADPSRTTVAFVDKTAGNIEIPEKLLTSGSLGGLLTFRTQELDQTRNSLNQMALAFADAFNIQHRAGVDANGESNKDFFSFGKPEALSNARNSKPGAIFDVSFSDTSKVQASDYKVSRVGSEWQVTRLSDNSSVALTDNGDSIEFDGLKIGITGTAANNDSFVVKPVNNAIINMSVKIKDESQIAMASATGSGESDNTNGQKLLNLQNTKMVGGNKTFNDAYASVVSDVGNKTSTLKVTSTTQKNVVVQLTNQQQSISGVNLDEEYGNLQRFQQYYLANAQVLQTASTLFDALLSIR
ncbi:flagellar hook-associated protein 1 [Atlantibacter hermannii]|nr:flagellar hook-associated protein 1 [Atlantibacter hermannii]